MLIKYTAKKPTKMIASKDDTKRHKPWSEKINRNYLVIAVGLFLKPVDVQHLHPQTQEQYESQRQGLLTDRSVIKGEIKGDRYLDLHRGRGGIEGVRERGHGAQKRKNRNRKG